MDGCTLSMLSSAVDHLLPALRVCAGDLPRLVRSNSRWASNSIAPTRNRAFPHQCSSDSRSAPLRGNQILPLPIAVDAAPRSVLHWRCALNPANDGQVEPAATPPPKLDAEIRLGLSPDRPRARNIFPRLFFHRQYART